MEMHRDTDKKIKSQANTPEKEEDFNDSFPGTPANLGRMLRKILLKHSPDSIKSGLHVEAPSNMTKGMMQCEAHALRQVCKYNCKKESCMLSHTN